MILRNDLIDHELLFDKIEAVGIRGVVLKQFNNFLLKRKTASKNMKCFRYTTYK